MRANTTPTTKLTRRSLASALISVVGTAAGTRWAGAEETPSFRVIVHPQNPLDATSRDFLMDVFLKRATRWHDGETIKPVDLRADAAARRKFSERVLKRSVAAVRSYWQQ